MLFTRSDLSPLLSQSGGSVDAAQLAKRKGQLLQRARTGFESELARRRTALQVGRRGGATQIGGIGRVQDGGGGGGAAGLRGVFGRIRTLLGLGSSKAAADEKSGYGEDEEEEEEDFDYFNWQTLQRQQASSSGANVSLSLDHLDEEVIDSGKAHWGVISLGRERDWLGGSGSTKEGRDDRDLRSFLTSL